MDQDLKPLVPPSGAPVVPAQDSGCSNKILESLDRLQATLKEMEKACRGKDAEVWHKPRKDGRKIYARVRCNVICVGEIDTVKQEFSAEIYLAVTWKEPSVKGMTREDVDWEAQWSPCVYFFNAVSIDKMVCKHNVIYPEGEPDGVPDAQVSYRMKATFKAGMTLHDFPFDHQELTIKLMSDWPFTDVEFVKDMNIKDSIRLDTFTAGEEWVLSKHVIAQPVLEDKAKTGSHRQYPLYYLTMHVRRKSGFYLWNVGLILMLILLLCFTCFAVSPEEPADRLSVTVTLLLTAVAFKYVVSQSLPTISYLTLLDKYVLCGLILQCLIVSQNAMASLFDTESLPLFDILSICVLAALVCLVQIVFMLASVIKSMRVSNKLQKYTKQYNELCDQINQSWQARQQQLKDREKEKNEQYAGEKSLVDSTTEQTDMTLFVGDIPTQSSTL
ncbi:gamma-aminobutyric acid receptor subunit beta-like [Patiria miniata]|uniref:Neurotransmitter-gated ion-channel ligand-binding domain-containing protein n=1 Tax=Patiria miniata TaxID=46514 RepID=A0A914A281_PATMI|nr:gamma-aminobutyric acid receptor subunit beta-like [Patiria miniata]